MMERSNDVERIVREVLAELGQAPGETARAAPTGASPRSTPATPEPRTPIPDSRSPIPEACNGQLVVTAQVVTLSEVEGRLDGVRQLVVPPRAVITPAARDELLQRNIHLVYAEAKSPASVRLVMLTVGRRFDPAPLVDALKQAAVNVESHTTGCVIAATDQLAAELVKPDTLGLLLTRHAAAALCLANRCGGVRAVGQLDAVGEVGANLLVLDPSRLGVFQLKRTVGEFCRGGKRQCPEVLKERLA